MVRFIRWGALFWGLIQTACRPSSDTRGPAQPIPTPTAASTGITGPVVDPRVKPIFDEFVEKCTTLNHTSCLERLSEFRGVRVGAYPIEVFSGKGPFPSGVSSQQPLDESEFINAGELVVPLEPFIGKNAECYGKIYLFHGLGHALLGWHHPEAESSEVRFSNTSLMGYETYPVCLQIEDNLSTLLDDLFAGRLRKDVAEGAYLRTSEESLTAYAERMKGFISRIPERGQLVR